MPTKDNLKQLLKIKEKMISLQVPTGVDLGKFHSLTMEPLAKSLSSGPGGKSNFQIISIAGETVALGKTGLLSTEKGLRDKTDFERLYIHADLKSEQARIEELFKRMFQLSNVFRRKLVLLPPKDPDDYELVMKSLKYRLQLLQKEVQKIETDSIEARQTLEHFYRLRDLVTGFESSWKKKQTKDYSEAVTSESSKPPGEEEPLSIDEEEAARLLEQFSLVLLQSKYQLPGFTFPFSPNEMIIKLRSLDVKKDEFLQAVEEGGHEVDPAVGEVLDREKQKAEREAALVMAARALLEEMVNGLPDMETQLDFVELLGDEPIPIEDFLNRLLNIVEHIATSRYDLFTRVKPLRARLAELETEVQAQDRRENILRGLLAQCQAKLSSENSDQANSEKRLIDEIEELKGELAGLDEERKSHLLEKQKLQGEIQRLQTRGLQFEQMETTTRQLQARLKEFEEQTRKKDEALQALQKKDQQMAEAQKKLQALQDLEIVSRTQRQEIAALQGQLKKMSRERMAVEAELGQYKSLQSLVESIRPNVNTSSMSPFEQFSARLQKMMSDRKGLVAVVRPSSSESKSQEASDSKEFVGGGEEQGESEEIDLPSILELKATMLRDYCEFLIVLSKLYERFYEDETDLLDKATSVLREVNSSPQEVAKAIQAALLHATGDNTNSLEPHKSLYQTLRTVLSSKEEFFEEALQKKGVALEDIQAANEKLQAAELPTYPALFYVYILALRDWINCVENISKPLECPQVPPNLRNPQVQCKLPPTSP